MRDSSVDATSPAIKRNCESLEDRIEEDDARAHDNRGGGQQHRPEAHCAGIDDGVLQRHALRAAQFDEVHQDDRIAHDDARAGNEADHRGRSEERAHHRVRRQNADQRQRDRRHDHQRSR